MKGSARLRIPVWAVLAIAAASMAAHAAGPAGSAVAMADDDASDEKAPLVATGDFNGDGIADTVEVTPPAAQRQARLTLRLGRHDGSWKTETSEVPVGVDPRALVVGDFNGDGMLDVIVGDARGALQEFLGDGEGKLSNARQIASLGSVVSVATGHFTRGRKLDLVVSDFQSNSAVILLAGDDGAFRLTWSFQLPKRGAQFHIATADFNRDGIADLVITSEDDANYEVMLGNGNGTFTYSPELSHLRDPNSYCPS